MKPQGLVGKYTIPLRIGLGMVIAFGEVQQPEDRENPEAIDAIVAEENYNLFLGGEGEHEELDKYQDVVEEIEGALVPGGIDIE